MTTNEMTPEDYPSAQTIDTVPRHVGSIDQKTPLHAVTVASNIWADEGPADIIVAPAGKLNLLASFTKRALDLAGSALLLVILKLIFL